MQKKIQYNELCTVKVIYLAFSTEALHLSPFMLTFRTVLYNANGAIQFNVYFDHYLFHVHPLPVLVQVCEHLLSFLTHFLLTVPLTQCSLRVEGTATPENTRQKYKPFFFPRVIPGKATARNNPPLYC